MRSSSASASPTLHDPKTPTTVNTIVNVVALRNDSEVSTFA